MIYFFRPIIILSIHLPWGPGQGPRAPYIGFFFRCSVNFSGYLSLNILEKTNEYTKHILGENILEKKQNRQKKQSKIIFLDLIMVKIVNRFEN